MNDKKKPGMEIDEGMKTQILEQIPTPVMAVDTDLKVTYMNAAGRNFLGKSWEKIKGKSCYDLFQSSHCNTPDCSMLHAIESGEKCSARNMVTLEGRTIHFEYYAVPLRDDSGDIVGGLEFIVDITERVRDEERLREQSRTIREISTPAIKLWEGIVVLPVVGVVDSMRAQQMMDTMLLNSRNGIQVHYSGYSRRSRGRHCGGQSSDQNHQGDQADGLPMHYFGHFTRSRPNSC